MISCPCLLAGNLTFGILPFKCHISAVAGTLFSLNPVFAGDED